MKIHAAKRITAKRTIVTAKGSEFSELKTSIAKLINTVKAIQNRTDQQSPKLMKQFLKTRQALMDANTELMELADMEEEINSDD